MEFYGNIMEYNCDIYHTIIGISHLHTRPQYLKICDDAIEICDGKRSQGKRLCEPDDLNIFLGGGIIIFAAGHKRQKSIF